MIRLTLAQMRQSLPRLMSAGLAILIGTAFITITLLAGNVMTSTTNASLSAQYGKADLLVAQNYMTEQDVATIRGVAGVAAADPLTGIRLELLHGRSGVSQYAVGVHSDPDLEPLEIAAGRYPAAAGEIALPQEVANRLDVQVGGQIEVLPPTLPDEQDTPATQLMTVVGTVSDPNAVFAMYGGAAVLSPVDFDVVSRAWAAPEDPTTNEVGVIVAAGASTETTRAALTEALPAAQVLTPDEQAEARTRELTGDQNVLVTAVLAFAAIALVVAALVIANTFQVLVAHRSRTLALLRAVGATRRQLSRSVLVEGTILGGAASLLGIAIGCGFGQLALTILATRELDAPIPTTITVGWSTVLVPLLVGVVVTILACTAPARSTARVTPLEAMRPAEIRTGGLPGRVRLVTFLVTTGLGVGLLVLGISLGMQDSAEIGIGVAVLGCAVSFTGMVLGSAFWLPPLVGLAGRLVARTGLTGRLAAANTIRNPRRTASTSAALFIGVTLVSTMSTGAISARASAESILDDHFPIDALVSSTDFTGDSPEFSREFLDTLSTLDGVRETTLARSAQLMLDGDEVSVVGIDAQEMNAVSRSPEVFFGPDPGTIVMERFEGEAFALAEGDSAQVTGTDGATLEMTVRYGDTGPLGMLVAATDLARLAPDAPVTEALLRLDDSARSTILQLEDAAAATPGTIAVTGVAVERMHFDRVIDITLGVVVALLAVAVVIALVGVTNTLSLSVLERRRESATLRAIGLTRRQLRRMLALEGILIAVPAALCGTVLGLVFGWAGALTAFSVVGEVTLAVPWRDLTILLVVALAAGWLASIAPARMATRTSPVASLAEA